MEIKKRSQKHVASGVAANFLSSLILVMALLLPGCARPSDQDQQQLSQLERRFGDRYTFKLEGEAYVHVVSKTGHQPLDEEAEEIYRRFAFTDFDKRVRRETGYVYFNFFAADGRFLYQLAYDPGTDKIERNSTPHY